MQQFKVGDWVIGKYSKNPIYIETIGTTLTNSSVTINGTFSVDQFTLWQPQKSEWCWFYDNTSSAVPILAQFDYMSEHIYITTEIEIPFSEEERSAYGFNTCIPFIGQLPKILKD